MRLTWHLQSVFFAAIILLVPTGMVAQVTTATLYGVVHDTSGALAPGAKVTATNQGTGFSRNTVTDARGEFALLVLPTGRYTIRIELEGFKTYTNQGLDLGANQVVRQTFTLEIGQVSENVTVTESAPLVEAASAAQKETLGGESVNALPVQRRSVTGLLNLSTGAFVGGAFRSPRLNGVADGGTGITVDGTDANANPEARAMGQYGGNNQIDVMSIEAVAEVQVTKGILPAEYGGVVGGQVNMISRSGTNEFHGALFENFQNDKFFARDPFFTAANQKPPDHFNQYGGSLGGPILKNRLFFFTTYEGYQERAGVSLTNTVPTQAFRDEILKALPFPETKLALDAEPLPTEPINADIGRYRGNGRRIRHDNHVVAKGDLSLLSGTLSVTYTRMRPYTLNPSIEVNGLNDLNFINSQDRVASQYVVARGTWVSETRYGWNSAALDRVANFWYVTDPASPAPTAIWDNSKRVGLITVSGLFATSNSEVWSQDGATYTFDQKISKVLGGHNLKMGFHWERQAGFRTDPQNAGYTFQNKADLLANIPNAVLYSGGPAAYTSHMDEWGLFIQDDWRVNKRLVLNLGLRYDYYAALKLFPVTKDTAEVVNLESPSDFQKLNFGAYRAPNDPYNANPFNFGPRAGFAYTLDKKGSTVLRGGVGVLYSPELPGTLRSAASDPFIPARAQWNRTQAAALKIKWPVYSGTLADILRQQAAGQKAIFSLIATDLPNPYSVQSMINVQRAFGPTYMAEVGYTHTAGRNFPLQDPLTLAFDRATGNPINPALGVPGGYYITSGQTLDYNGVEMSFRKRFSRSIQFDLHYTVSKGWAQQGGDLSASYYTDVGNTQDFFNPNGDRSPINSDALHRFTADVLYEFPQFHQGKGVLGQVLGGWRFAALPSVRSGLPLRLSQPSGITNSRPDFLGGSGITSNWGDTLQYLNTSSFARVPTYSATGATVRPGTSNPDDVRGPSRFTVDMTLAKDVRITERIKIEIRADAFNAFNHVNYTNPNTTITSPQFGQITSAGGASGLFALTGGGARSGQIGARLSF